LVLWRDQSNQLKGWTPKPIKRSPIEEKALEGKHVDVLVIGGGVVGCAILRELSRYQLSALLVEKEEDLAMGPLPAMMAAFMSASIWTKTPQNSIIFSVRGQDLRPALRRPRRPYREDGQSVAFKSLTLKGFAAPYLREKARKNHIPGGVKILNREEMLKIEPTSRRHQMGRLLPRGRCVSPYELTIALGENAVSNGAEVSFNTFVESMEVKDHQIFRSKPTAAPFIRRLSSMRPASIATSSPIWRKTNFSQSTPAKAPTASWIKR
jgi:glycerol-3-phosphate dehydrogenase